jgi:hypothetical protein
MIPTTSHIFVRRTRIQIHSWITQQSKAMDRRSRCNRNSRRYRQSIRDELIELTRLRRFANFVMQNYPEIYLEFIQWEAENNRAQRRDLETSIDKI